MAVIVQYIVVRNGEEKMTFATKKEADAYDKMLDIADNLFDFLDKLNLGIGEAELEKLSFQMAEKKDDVTAILRGVKPQKKTVKKTSSKQKESPAQKAKPPKQAANG